MKLRFLSAALFLAILLTACNSGGKTGLLVPADAGLVVHVDLSSLSSKLSWEEIKQSELFTKMKEEARDTIAKKLLNDPETSGIDTKGSFVFFTKTNSDGGYFTFQGDLKDAAKFSAMIKEAGEGKLQEEKDGSYSVVKLDNDAVLYYSDKKFVLVADGRDMSREFNRNATKYPLDSLKNYAKKVFSLKGKDLLDSDKRFADLITDKADAHYWVNSGSMYGGMMTGMMAMMKLDVLFKGNIGAGKVNFENGKIAFEAKQYFGKELAEFFKKHQGQEISGETLKRLPQGDVLMAFALGYSPEGVKEFLKLLGVDGMANAALAKTGFSIDDFVKANKGQLAFALTDFSVKQVEESYTMDDGEKYSYNREKPEPKFVFGVEVGDKSSFQKLIDAVKKNILGSAAPDTAVNKEFAPVLGDKWFALASNNDMANAFVNGATAPAYTSNLSGHNGAGFIDIQKMITAAGKEAKDSSSKQAIALSANFWRIAKIHWDLKGGEAVTKGEVTLADAQTNALKQLNKYFNELYKLSPKRERHVDFAEMPADSSEAINLPPINPENGVVDSVKK